MSNIKPSIISFIPGVLLLGTLTGCVGYVGTPRGGVAYDEPPPSYGAYGGVVQDDYVYYPGYQVYYSSTRRQYIYRDGRSWVTRPAPPHVSVNVLFASPSVRLDFHDSPVNHHAAVVRQYQKDGRRPAPGPTTTGRLGMTIIEATDGIERIVPFQPCPFLREHRSSGQFNQPFQTTN